MAYETEHFRCPLCGQHAPVTRLDEGPFGLEAYHKILGGKLKVSPQERERRRHLKFKRGSAPGSLEYFQVPTPEEMKQKTRAQLEQIRKQIDSILEGSPE